MTCTKGGGVVRKGGVYCVEWIDSGGEIIGLVGFPGRFDLWRFAPASESPCGEASPVSDNVFRPNHYARFVIEPLTFINANKLPYNIGNVVKYVCRYDAKNGLEDLRKARRYIDIQIETLEREARVAAGENPTDVWKAVL